MAQLLHILSFFYAPFNIKPQFFRGTNYEVMQVAGPLQPQHCTIDKKIAKLFTNIVKLLAAKELGISAKSWRRPKLNKHNEEDQTDQVTMHNLQHS